jgi:RNA polymerase sigma-70 factor (ECF subfamily)
LKNFEEIYEEHRVAMARVASKMVYDSDEVSDIVQEVFIYLHKKLYEGKKIIHLRSWLYRATFNKCVDHLRKQDRFVDVCEAKDIECKEHSIENEDIKSAINLAMCKLSANEKVMVVAYSEGMSYKEIAELTGITFTSVGKTLSRTLKKLSNEMKKEDYGLY